MIIAIIIFKIKEELYNIKFQDIIDLCIILIPISILCARIYYVVFEIDKFLKNPIEILNIRNGGLAIYGGIIGGIITCYVFAKKRKINILNLTDYIVPCLALGQAIGRWGNFFNIEAYGTETTNLLRMGIVENNFYKEVHPTFLYESVVTFTLAIILFRLQKNRKFKRRNYIYLLNSLFFCKNVYRRNENRQLNARRLQNISNNINSYFCSILYNFC